MPTTNAGDEFIPSQLIAGDSWNFTLSLPVYPATQGWLATWQLRGPGQAFNFVATVDPDGTDFDWNIVPAITANIPAAIYGYRVIVVGQPSTPVAGQQYTAIPATPYGAFARVTVQPNLGALTNYDIRSQYEIELNTIQATILAIETNQVQSATYSGQTFTNQNLEDLRKREVQLIERIKQANVRAAIEAGLASGRQTKMQFVNY